MLTHSPVPDRLGRQQAATNGPVALGRLYSDTGLLLSEHHLTGPLAGLSVTNRYDEYLRRTNLLLRHPVAGILNQADYAFDAAGRLASVSSGGNTAAYGYLANSPLVEHIWFTNGSTLRMTTTKQYDFLNRLTRIESAAGSSNVSVSAYQYNLASQRTALTNADSSYWIYTYDPLGQVTSGKKYWSNGTPVAGQQFEYGFDDIGNRQTAASGGNQSGAGLRPASYSANLLNQYTSRTVPGYVDVLGKAASAATVTVWGDQSIAKLPLGTVGPVRAERQGDYWRAEVPINNSTGAVWLTVTNWAVLNQGTNADLLSSLTGSVLVAQSPESFTYDLDGNLTSDSLWTNVWNGENRRLTVESSAGVSPATARMREQWTFLPDGRWIERIVSTWNTNTINYQPSTTNRFVWDGNVLLAVLDHTNGLCQSFTRGLDLSGTPQGAGGAGGLVFVGHRTSAIAYHTAAFDGNGNVMALVNLSDGTTSAEYAYGPFAEPLQAIGPMARANPLRFSTQYADDVTGDVNYLFRAYNARTGRWPNRDPFEENGGANLYAAFRNNPLQMLDVLGLWATDVHYVATRRWAIAGSYPEQAAEMIAVADEAVDSIGNGTSFWPIAGDQSYHFNRNLNGGPDSRYVHFARHKLRAQSLCTIRLGNDSPEMAAVQLGTALHPLQDVVAHGDYGIRMHMYVRVIHNAFSPQKNFGTSSDYPDITWLDAVGSPDGRPAGNAMHTINNDGVDYAIYTPGIRRWILTKERTEGVLAGFRSYVKANGGCKCKQFFGVN